nr:hypothetical protein [Candidatus Gracilibacteria bacterium]
MFLNQSKKGIIDNYYEFIITNSNELLSIFFDLGLSSELISILYIIVSDEDVNIDKSDYGDFYREIDKKLVETNKNAKIVISKHLNFFIKLFNKNFSLEFKIRFLNFFLKDLLFKSLMKGVKAGTVRIINGIPVVKGGKVDKILPEFNSNF